MTAKSAKQTGLNPQIGIYFVVYLLTALWMVPVLIAVFTAFRTNSDITARGIWSLPNSVSFQSFIEAWNRGGLSHYLPNSFIITLPALVIHS